MHTRTRIGGKARKAFGPTPAATEKNNRRNYHYIKKLRKYFQKSA